VPRSTFAFDWQGQSCFCRVSGERDLATAEPLLTIHPIGVGLSGAFWQRFTRAWKERGLEEAHPLIHPDLLGCGRSAMPDRPLRPQDWAQPLARLLDQGGGRPVWLLAQGASLPVALELQALRPEAVRGLVLFGPPSWKVMTAQADERLSAALWRGFFHTPLGNLFYRYARTERFLHSFSRKELFARELPVDHEWLTMLREGSRDPASRHAVFSFLAGFWRRDYGPLLRSLPCPVLVLFGEEASGISRRGRGDTPTTKAEDYGRELPRSRVRILPGRNVLPWESTEAVVEEVAAWIEAGGPTGPEPHR
jgi:pimeloyl-ACP methyl ester carboxylesterase